MWDYGQPKEVTIIAREGEYSGYEVDEVLCYEYEGKYYITNNSHCSCNGTWDGWNGENPEYGYTKERLIEMAQKGIDPAWPNALPERYLDEKDSDYQWIVSLYKQILEHFGVSK